MPGPGIRTPKAGFGDGIGPSGVLSGGLRSPDAASATPSTPYGPHVLDVLDVLARLDATPWTPYGPHVLDVLDVLVRRIVWSVVAV